MHPNRMCGVDGDDMINLPGFFELADPFGMSIALPAHSE